MKLDVDEARVRLLSVSPDDESELAKLAPLVGRRRRFRVVKLTRHAAELAAETLPWPGWATLRELRRAFGARAPDWLAAGAMVLASLSLGRLAVGQVPPRWLLGAALLLAACAAGMVGALSWRGVTPAQATRRWWRWAYWYGAGLLLAGLASAGLAAVAWLAWVLGSLAWRLTP